MRGVHLVEVFIKEGFTVYIYIYICMYRKDKATDGMMSYDITLHKLTHGKEMDTRKDKEEKKSLE